ncbi:short-chain dehydrogenase/reductase SDR (plasmid) [Azospirillum sp. B510]|uniref:SDR family NAD(P)-dependent oxidoreductase n=1 Tax=Azospirillum sp. (strain B510) TaxID=137722 RepID=UPI0001C4CB99|nr:SDR family NAD(P)-dependent oxidoreductase [Azospirillum sp. B510]BAI74842.1 short-chain dehydrogenase/reductase SDR [Azospirillum sp. B510]
MDKSNSWPGLYSLAGQTAVVTGAGSGIGASIAALFAAAGARVVIAEIDEAAGAATAERLMAEGRQAIAVTTDVADDSSIAALFDAAEEAFGRIGILVNNAGIFPKIHFLDVTKAQWEAMQAVNLRGAFVCMQEAVRRMRRHGQGGAIVNVSSVSSKQVAVFNNVAYNASKAGVNALTSTAALEFAGDGIRVNAVLPGAVMTGGARKASATASLPMAGPMTQPGRMPLGRVGTGEDIAAAALFLASPAASYVTGQFLAVDGGFQIS